jgi:transposase
LSRSTFVKKARVLRGTVKLLLWAGTRLPTTGGSGAHILEHREALWHFVSHDGVQPADSQAVGRLRGFALWRKSSLGSQSARGHRFAANLKSVVHTCRKQKRHVFSSLVEALQAAFSHRAAPSLLPAR